MIDTLDDLILSEQSILERVDEYALYCFYLKFQPEIGRPIISPIRRPGDPDTQGSFVIFYPTRVRTHFEFLWSDNGTGQKGNVFQMISLMFGGITIPSVYQMIDADFGLGFGDGATIKHERIDPGIRPKAYRPCEIKVRSRSFTPEDISYWAQYGIAPTILNRYNITSVDLYWSGRHQSHPRVIAKHKLCYAYRIWSKYKIYQPYADKDNKFRNDYTPIHIEGYPQLRYESDTLIITKALKDVAMFDANFGQLGPEGFETVAGRGENMPIPGQALRHFERKYKRIIVWLDNDGKESGLKYYPDYEHVRNPQGLPKDPSDFYHTYGKDSMGKLINQLTGLL